MLFIPVFSKNQRNSIGEFIGSEILEGKSACFLNAMFSPYIKAKRKNNCVFEVKVPNYLFIILF